MHLSNSGVLVALQGSPFPSLSSSSNKESERGNGPSDQPLWWKLIAPTAVATERNFYSCQLSWSTHTLPEQSTLLVRSPHWRWIPQNETVVDGLTCIELHIHQVHHSKPHFHLDNFQIKSHIFFCFVVHSDFSWKLDNGPCKHLIKYSNIQYFTWHYTFFTN